MMGHPASHVVVLLLTAGALALSGCTGVADATKYYMLSPSPAAPADSAHTAVSGPSVGVGPVVIPRYLERAQIVTRGTNDEVEISEYRRWAEPLESGIAEVLADNLAAQVGSERVAVFPWRGATARALDYRVVVVVLRFDGSPGRRVTLDVRWHVLDKAGKELVLKRSTIGEPITDDGYQPLILGMNRLLATLAHEIATEILSRADTPAAKS
jgi:uncharacterized lipoprotein YmbA